MLCPAFAYVFSLLKTQKIHTLTPKQPLTYKMGWFGGSVVLLYSTADDNALAAPAGTLSQTTQTKGALATPAHQR